MIDESSNEPNRPADNYFDAKIAKKRLALSIAYLTRRIDRSTFETLRAALSADPEFDMIAALDKSGSTIRNEFRDMTEVIDDLVTEANPENGSTDRTLADLTESLIQIENTLDVRTFKDPLDPDDIASTEAGIQVEGKTEVNDTFTISDRYQFIDVIKVGGQAVVCRARDVELNRTVAIKIPHAKGRSLEVACRKIVVEARITGQLNHPAVIPIFALDKRADSRPFLVLPYYPQGEFTREIRQLHPGAESPWIDPAVVDLKLRSIVQSMVMLSRAVAFAHELGVVHRDIKPGNILIGDHGEVFMADWGLAKNLRRPQKPQENGNDEPSTTPGSSFTESDTTDHGGGTANYMSKEQALGQVDLQNEKTDIFLLGSTLYSVIYGRPPFKDRTSAASYDVEFPKSEVRGIDWSLIGICKKAMAESQPDRYPTALDLASDLELWLADQPLVFVEERRSKKVARVSRRFSRSIAVAAMMLLAGTVGLLIMNDRIATARDNETIAKNDAIESRKQVAAALEETKQALAKETEATKAANEATKVANEATKAANEARQNETAALKKEYANFRSATNMAMDLLDTIAKKMPLVPGTEKIRYDAVIRLSKAFNALMAQNRNRPEIFAVAAQVEREAGNIGRFVGDKEIPLKHYLKALAIWNALLKGEPENVNYHLQKALALRDFSLWYERIGDLPSAEKRSEESLVIMKTLRQIGERPEFDELEIVLLARKGDLLMTLGRETELAEVLGQLETLLERWFGKHREPTNQDLKISIGAKLTRAHLELRGDRFESAKDKYQAAFDEASANKDKDQDFRLLMGEAHFGKARALQGMNDPVPVKQANAELQEVFRTMRALQKDSPTVQVYAERVATVSAEMLRFERLSKHKFEDALDPVEVEKLIERLVTEMDGPELRSTRAQFRSEMAYRENDQAKRKELAAQAASDLDYVIEKLPLRNDYRKERETIRTAFGQ